MRRRIHVLLFLTVLLGILAGCSETSPTMARVGNTNISEAQFTEYMEQNKRAFDPANSGGRSPEQIRFDLFQRLITEEVAMEEARRNGYGIDSASQQSTQQQIDTVVRQGMTNPEKDPTFADLEKLATDNNFASYAAVRSYLARQATLDKFAQNTEVEGAPQLSFLTEGFVPLVNPDQSPVTPEQEETARQEAAAMAAQLRAGADISDVTAKYASDPQAGGLQGELGWVDVSGPGPDFAAAVNALPLNEWSDPIRSQLGWHVVKITGRRPATFEAWRQILELPQGQALMAAKVEEYKASGAYEVYIDPASVPTPLDVTEQK